MQQCNRLTARAARPFTDGESTARRLSWGTNRSRRLLFGAVIYPVTVSHERWEASTKSFLAISRPGCVKKSDCGSADVVTWTSFTGSTLALVRLRSLPREARVIGEDHVCGDVSADGFRELALPPFEESEKKEEDEQQVIHVWTIKQCTFIDLDFKSHYRQGWSKKLYLGCMIPHPGCLSHWDLLTQPSLSPFSHICIFDLWACVVFALTTLSPNLDLWIIWFCFPPKIASG